MDKENAPHLRTSKKARSKVDKMATKTATLSAYHVYGSSNAYAVDVKYKGKILKSFSGETVQRMETDAKTWALKNGFTKIKG